MKATAGAAYVSSTTCVELIGVGEGPHSVCQRNGHGFHNTMHCAEVSILQHVFWICLCVASISLVHITGFVPRGPVCSTDQRCTYTKTCVRLQLMGDYAVSNIFFGGHMRSLRHSTKVLKLLGVIRGVPSMQPLGRK